MFIKKHTQGEGGGRIHQPGTKHRPQRHTQRGGRELKRGGAVSQACAKYGCDECAVGSLGRRDRENQHKKAAGKNVRKRRRVCWFRIEGACGVCMGKCPVAVCRPVSEVQGERNRGEAKGGGRDEGGIGREGGWGEKCGVPETTGKSLRGHPRPKKLPHRRRRSRGLEARGEDMICSACLL